MKFSIITPSLNQGRFIRDCIESVKTQTGVDWEHIVVDAGSTDETLRVLREYPHLQWTSEPDHGMSDGINQGFRRATGDWLMWLNADDYLLPGALQRVAGIATGQPADDVIYGECLFVDQDKHLIRRKRDHPFDFNILLFYGCFIPSTATFFHRRIIEAGHFLDVHYRVCMDFDYFLRLSLAGYQFAYLPVALAGFRWHDANTSSVQFTRRRQERLEIQRCCLHLLSKDWLAGKRTLDVLFRLYQAKRVLRRTARRLRAKFGD